MLLRGSSKMGAAEYRDYVDRARRRAGAASSKLGGGANTSDVYHRIVDIRSAIRAEDEERRRCRW